MLLLDSLLYFLLYILIPNAAGKYSPAAVRVKHFNESEYNPEDVTINSTPL